MQQYHLMFWLASADSADRSNLPEVIDRIIAGWAAQFASRAEAEAFWAQLHGRLMLGSATLSLTAPTRSASPVADPSAPAAAVELIADEPDTSPAEREDVTLL